MIDAINVLKRFGINPNETDYLFKIIIVGDSGVGKSCLFVRYTDDTFNDGFGSTIGVDFKPQHVEYKGKVIRLNLFDSAGQERFRSITSSYFRGAQGILLVYDVTDRSSFKDLKVWLKEIRKNSPDGLGMVLVGNKADRENEIVISTEEGQEFADSLGIPFIETSAKKGDGVKDAFSLLVKEIVDKVPKEDFIYRKHEPLRERQRFRPKCCS